MFADMRWDRWEIIGLCGEFLFFARMLVQWLASEKVKKPVIPAAYWYLSLAGALILVAYALHIGSLAVLAPQVVGLFFYSRGLQLEFHSRRRGEWRRAMGFDNPGYSWPFMSVIVPVHNEEAVLPGTLENLTALDYPGLKEVVAALNGCADGSRTVAERYPVHLAESARSGMSFGKNLGAAHAAGAFLVFIDADTRVPADALTRLAEAAAGKRHFIGTVAGAPERGGGVVRVCFLLANFLTRRARAHAPGGVMLMDRETFDRIGGFDENLPQGTSTDCINRGVAAGAEYVFVDSFKAVTSIRRFEKRGIVRQMLDWRKNHKAFRSGGRGSVAGKAYENIR